MKTRIFATLFTLLLGAMTAITLNAQTVTGDGLIDDTAIELMNKADQDSLNIAAGEEAAAYLWKALRNDALAMKYYGRVLRQAERTGNKMAQVKTLWQMARISSDTGNFLQAADYLEKDLVVVRDMDRLKNKDKQITNILFNLAVSYLSVEDFDRAEAYVEEGLAVPDQDQTDLLQLQQQIKETREMKAKREKTMSAIGAFDHAQELFKQGKWAEAIGYYADAIELYSDRKDNISYIDSQFNTGVCYMKLGLNDKALPYLAEGVDNMIALQGLTPEQALAYCDMIAECCPAPEQQDLALECYEKALQFCKERAGESTIEVATCLTMMAKANITKGENLAAKRLLDKADIVLRKAGRKYNSELMKVREIKKQLL